MKTEKSCGGIVFRKIGGNIEFLIIQQKQGSHWFFPKGHIEDNESEEQTALREIYEETGFHVDILPGFREIFSYYIDDTKSIEKNVVFFICEIVSGQLIMSDELQNCMWLDYEQAMKTLTHDNSKAVLTKAYNFLSL